MAGGIDPVRVRLGAGVDGLSADDGGFDYGVAVDDNVRKFGQWKHSGLLRGVANSDAAINDGVTNLWLNDDSDREAEWGVFEGICFYSRLQFVCIAIDNPDCSCPLSRCVLETIYEIANDMVRL